MIESEKATELVEELLSHLPNIPDEFTIKLAMTMAELNCKNIISDLDTCKEALGDHIEAYTCLSRRTKYWYSVIKCIKSYGLVGKR